KISDIEKFIERFRYKATKARQVQSRVKMLEKMQRIELEEENRSQIHFQFPPAPNSGVVPVEIIDATKMYDELLVFENVNAKIERGDKIAFLGRNGEGKSTLAKIIAGVEPLTFGECKYGYNVSVAYFAQQQAEALNGNKTVFETVEEASAGEVRTKLRSLLGAFLFQGDDAFKYVRVLSGGEKSRLALAKMLLQPSNLLVLDEPTNHLDMRSKAVLKEALQKFNGTVIVVSHDRDFLDGLVNKVFEFKDHQVKEYLGGLEDWQWKKQQLEAKAKEDASPKSSSKKAQPPKFPDKPHDKSKDKRRDAAQKGNSEKKVKPLKEKIAKLEKNIAATEAKKTELETVMANPDFYKDGGKSKEVLAEYNTLKDALSALYFEWAEVNEDLERAGK
ncbi:MAG TPA: ATP-binding cassette domain-containing protein, partial [Candidatus Kapabacteria bacterium]|nr:ATP-binding cassette domain-containing protein [Candidatus Kapabacteria bacterium]